MKNQIGLISVAVAIIIGAFIISSSQSLDQVGRFELVQRENNRMVLIDTKTGQFWDIPSTRIGNEPILEETSLKLK